MDSIHEGGIVAHIRRKRTEEMPDALLMFDVDIEVSDHYDAAVGANALFAPAELPRFHVALHDVDAVFLIEGDAGDLIEADNIVLANQPALPVAVVDEHARDRGLAAGNQVSVRRDLLE